MPQEPPYLVAALAEVIERSRRNQGRQRSSGKRARAFAILASLGVRESGLEIAPTRLSRDAHAELLRVAAELDVHATGFATYLLERELRRIRRERSAPKPKPTPLFWDRRAALARRARAERTDG